jgi:MFS transporter, ACS family, tartrate transporter
MNIANPTAGLSPSEGVRRKVSRRVLPFFFLLYIVAYIDRANVAFAKLPMVADLGFSEAVFGFGAGVFFLGYFLLEIPGAVIVERWSARLWISRILITWGACTVLVGFIRTANEFYIARFLLGLAEAGFFPGVIVYMSHWFPARDRGRALAGFILAVPISFVVGAPLSTWCMSIDWFGIPGWRWIFILQGLPAILLGCVTPFYLTDRPKDAKWLRPEERDWLDEELREEREQKRSTGHFSILQALRQRYVLTLAAALFCVVLATYGFILWLPTTIQKASGLSTSESTLLSTLPFLAATISVWYSGRSSDRSGKRKLHTVVPLVGCAVFFALTRIPDQPLPITILWMCLTGLMLWAWAPSFWVLPTLKLGETAAAASIGFINSIGNLGGFVGPWFVGALLTSQGSYTTAVAVLCSCFLLAATLIGSLRIPHPAAIPSVGLGR